MLAFSPSVMRAAERLARGLSVPAGALALAAALATLGGCKPSIGDKCILSTDCSITGDRQCDTSQPEGYCTQFNCAGNTCPDDAACVLFNSALPGCGFDDRAGASGSRVGRSACVAQCSSDGDCRAGYVCADPRLPPWGGLILDDDQSRRGCLVAPLASFDDGGVDASATAPVCAAVGPDVSPIDASAPSIADAAPPSTVDAGADADAGSDAGDAGDASDGG